MKLKPKPASTRRQPERSVSKAMHALNKEKAKMEVVLVNNGSQEEGGKKEVWEAPAAPSKTPFRAARKFATVWPKPKSVLPPEKVVPTPSQSKSKVGEDDYNIIRRRTIAVRETPPLNGNAISTASSASSSSRCGNSSSNHDNMNGEMKTPKKRSPESSAADEQTPDRPPPLVETPRTSRRGRKIFRRRTWPWETPNDHRRRGAKRKLEELAIGEEEVKAEEDAEEVEVKERDDYFMGSTLQYLFQHDQSHKVPTMPRYLDEWDNARKETAVRALNYIKREMTENGSGGKSDRSHRLDNHEMYEVTGKRTTETGVEYLVEWRQGTWGNVNNSNNSEEFSNGSEYLYFEDYNHHEYFFGHKKKKRKKEGNAGLKSTPTITTTRQQKIRASPRLLSMNKAKDANNNPIK